MNRVTMGEGGKRGINLLGLLFLLIALVLGLLSLYDEGFLIPLFAVVIFAPPLWTFLSARTSHIRGAMFWAFLALFGNVVGMILYCLIALPEEGDPSFAPPVCPECACSPDRSWKFCPLCGNPLLPKDEEKPGNFPKTNLT